MQRTLTTATFAAGGLLALSLACFTSAASAAPLRDAGAMPLPLASDATPEVTLVSGGCGPYRHRGGNGFCYPNRAYGYGGYGGGYYRPYGYYHPYGYHRPFGFF